MKRLRIVRILGGAAFAALACRGDPTASLRGGAKSIDLSSNVMFIDSGASKPLQVVVRDEQLNPLAADVTVTSAAPTIAAVAADTTTPTANGVNHNYVVKGIIPGPTKIVVQSGGVTDSTRVFTLPIRFPGGISSTTPVGGDTVVFTSTTQFKFDLGAGGASFFGDHRATVLRVTPDSLVLLTPFSLAGAPTVQGVNVTYVPGLTVALRFHLSVTQTGDIYGEADSGYTTAPTLALPTQTDSSTKYQTDMVADSNSANCSEGSGLCAIFKYVANGTDSLEFKVDWEGSDSVDVYSCDNTGVSGCFESYVTGVGGKDTLTASATAAQPEKFSWIPPAGIHYFVLEVRTPPTPANFYITITKKN